MGEDGIQALYLKSDTGGDDPVLFRMVCNTDDGVVWMNSQALGSDEAAWAENRRADIAY